MPLTTNRLIAIPAIQIAIFLRVLFPALNFPSSPAAVVIWKPA